MPKDKEGIAIVLGGPPPKSKDKEDDDVDMKEAVEDAGKDVLAAISSEDPMALAEALSDLMELAQDYDFEDSDDESDED